MKSFYQKYKHALPAIIYMVIYLVWFVCIEQRATGSYTVIHMKIDDHIPFCEWFIIPYYLWFLYVAVAIFYCFFKNKQEYFKTCAFLGIGMTVFLVVSTLWPNGHHLRPYTMPRDNILTTLVTFLYSADTPTNIWPSIHVYNSIGAHLALIRNPELGKNKIIHAGSWLLCVSIILSTVFLKQHSMFDVITAFIMAAVVYQVVYHMDIVSYLQAVRSHRQRRVRRV